MPEPVATRTFAARHYRTPATRVKMHSSYGPRAVGL